MLLVKAEDNYNVLFLCLALSFVRSCVLQERPEEHCSVREVESFHNSAHHVELEDCFKLYTKDEKVRNRTIFFTKSAALKARKSDCTTGRHCLVACT